MQEIVFFPVQLMKHLPVTDSFQNKSVFASVYCAVIY